MRTLYEDWQLRRERLAKDGPNPLCIGQLTVLDFLLSRYADEPLAWECARCPLHSELIFCTRAILIHHHMALREFGSIRTIEDAPARARTILAHISKINPQATIGPPGSTADDSDGNFPELFNEPRRRTAHPATAQLSAKRGGTLSRIWRLCSGEIRTTDRNSVKLALAALPRAFAAKDSAWVERLCNWALSNWGDNFRPALQEELIDTLFAFAQTSDYETCSRRCNAALDVLERCVNVGVLHAYVRSWIENIGSEPFLERIHAFVMSRRSRCADFVRMQLADDNPLIRTRTANLLSHLGDLHDVGMLQDLLALPDMAMEIDERNACVSAMRVLSGMN